MDDRIRRVALVSDTRDFGGAEVYLVTLAGALRGRCEFHAVVGDGLHRAARAGLDTAGVAVRVVKGLGRRPRAAAFADVVRALREISPDVVHINASDQGDALLPLLAAPLAGRPVVATVHLILPQRARWREAIAQYALRRADRLVAVSHAVGDQLHSRGLDATVVVNGLPGPELRADAREALGLRSGDVVVGGIGRLVEQKGWDVLCCAATIVRERTPEVSFVVVGDGPQRACLERLAGGVVRFVGHWDDAASLLGAFDVLAMPSRYEGLGLSAIEAMLAGVPVVASDVEALRDVVGDAGVLVPPDDPVSLGEAIIDLVRAPTRRRQLAAAGARRARNRFAAERMADETLAVYLQSYKR